MIKITITVQMGAMVVIYNSAYMYLGKDHDRRHNLDFSIMKDGTIVIDFKKMTIEDSDYICSARSDLIEE